MKKLKLKTKKGVAKRFKLTKKGRIKYHRNGKGHLLTNKKRSRLRKLRRATTIGVKKDEKFIKALMPYG